MTTTTNYHGQNTLQKDRRKILENIRQQLGDKIFADFLIEVISNNSGSVSFSNYQTLAACYTTRLAARIKQQF